MLQVTRGTRLQNVPDDSVRCRSVRTIFRIYCAQISDEFQYGKCNNELYAAFILFIYAWIQHHRTEAFVTFANKNATDFSQGRCFTRARGRIHFSFTGLAFRRQNCSFCLCLCVSIVDDEHDRSRAVCFYTVNWQLIAHINLYIHTWAQCQYEDLAMLMYAIEEKLDFY